MLNIVKNILAWADKEPITPHEAIEPFNDKNSRSLIRQIKQIGVNVRDIDDLVNPPPEIAPRLGELIDILVLAIDSLEYHPMTIEAVALSLRHKAIVKTQNLFPFLYERYLVVPSDDKIRNPQARGVGCALANSLAEHFVWEDFNKIQALFKDESLGESRMLLLHAFRRFLHKEEVRQLLAGFANHPDLAFESKKLLKRKVRVPKSG